MANFIAVCLDCEKKAKQKAKRRKKDLTQEEVEELILFETAHSIKASEEEIRESLICPRCEGSNCEKTLLGYDIVGYIRGNGYLDTVGAKRDMNLFHLTATDPDTGKTLDPYDQYRAPGEVEEMKTKLQRSGKHNPKRRHYDTKVMAKAVKEATSSPDPTIPDNA